MFAFVTSFIKFLFVLNLDYWFLFIPYSLYTVISDGECGCSLFYERNIVIFVNVFYQH